MEESLGEITGVRHLTLSVIEFTVRMVAPSSVSFNAGQQMVLKVGGKDHIVPIAFPPLESNSEVVLLLDVSEGSSLREAVKDLKVGDQVTLDGPAGDFSIKDPNRDILALAGGVGIAPFAAIVPQLLVSGFSNKLKLIFEVNAEEDVFYFERFNALATRYPNFSFIPMVVRPHAHWPGEVGSAGTYIQVSAEYLQTFAPYVCGKAEFINSCLEKWKKYVPKGDKPITCVLG